MLIERTRLVGGLLLACVAAAWVYDLIRGGGWGSGTIEVALMLGSGAWSIAFWRPVLVERAWKLGSDRFWSWFVPEGLLLATFVGIATYVLGPSGHGDQPLIYTAVAFFAAAIDAVGVDPPAEKDGWQVLRPSPGLYLVGLAGVAMVLLFGLLGAAELVDWIRSEAETTAFDLFKFAFALFIAVGAVMVAWPVFLTRVAYGPAGVRYRRPFRTEIIPWIKVARMGRTMFGPYLEIRGGRRIRIAENTRGFEWFVAELHDQRIEVDI